MERIRERFNNLSDERTGTNISYQMSDAALSAFAVFFMQNPSFLAQQKWVEGEPPACGGVHPLSYWRV